MYESRLTSSLYREMLSGPALIRGGLVTRTGIEIERHATPNPTPSQRVDPNRNPNPRKFRLSRRNIASWRSGAYGEMVARSIE